MSCLKQNDAVDSLLLLFSEVSWALKVKDATFSWMKKKKKGKKERKKKEIDFEQECNKNTGCD